ncbi:IS1595 family transposase [Mesorhizobium amorphae]|uniref:ISSpo8, transposase n=1 Tax=Mesorhizobium amorphae CCNWGS0123 TaxID=1082933 RepID=G6Y884_9HYPH|nr:IS1595 family transposase [Mesorhizobium amorphae]ANT51201.1 transposase [Mesorhizobium amorphae CCNWGS0123]EHH12051.1 ISSpo8, transposase [Mesorhizobium amorphae CCNWGS0123]GLR42594.1 DDE transposase [Mesorhizobium amorphae]
MKLDSPIFQDAEAARIHLEAQRWPHGPNCPHCGNARPDRITKMEGKAHRPGLYNCMECREQFTVTVGTVFERSKIALNKWLLATFLMASSKKGMSAHQLHRMLGVTYKTAWFMAHRIREAMKEDVKSSGPIGGEGKIVEADETYIGKRETPRKLARGRVPTYTKSGKSGGAQKRIVVGLVERGGQSRMFHLNDATATTVRDVLVRNVSRDTTLFTDSSRIYTRTGEEYAAHKTTNHAAGEYARREGDVVIHSNTIEGVFSVFKRGMVGVYQHCGEAHLHRYLAEFDFRYNRRAALKVTDTERHDQLLAMIEGKRLTYRRIGEASNA